MNSNYWAESAVVMCSTCLKIGERSSWLGSYIMWQTLDAAHLPQLCCTELLVPCSGLCLGLRALCSLIAAPFPQVGTWSPKCAKTPNGVFGMLLCHGGMCLDGGFVQLI